MRKRTLVMAVVVVLAVFVCMNAYAGCDAANCPIKGFFNSIGGFLYNALPWNWGNWWGK